MVLLNYSSCLWNVQLSHWLITKRLPANNREVPFFLRRKLEAKSGVAGLKNFHCEANMLSKSMEKYLATITKVENEIKCNSKISGLLDMR